MLMLSRHRLFLRCVSLLTALTFLPTSVQAWNFMPQVQAVVLAAKDGPKALAADKMAELESGEESPAPLSTPKQEQLAENRAIPDSIPGNFVERYAQTEGALPGLSLAALPPTDQAGLKTMSREELGRVASTLHPERPLRNPKLPEAASVLARIDAAVAAHPAPKAKAVQVAQADNGGTLPGEREVRGPLGPQAAVDALAAADSLANAGQRSEALIAYFDVMDTYPRTNEALWADQGMWNSLEDLVGGRLDRQAVAPFEDHLVQWTPNTADGAYAAATWDSERALAEHKAANEEVALAYAAKAETRSLGFLRTYANSYLSMSVADYYQEIVNLQGPEKERGSMLALWDQALAMEHAPGRLGALYAFGSYAGSVEANAAGEAIIAWSNVLSEMKQPYVEELLGDSTVPFWVKGFICEYAGRSQAGLGEYSESKAWYDRGVALSTHTGPTHWFLAYMSALVTTKMYPMSPETGVDAMARYLETYPDSTYAGNANIELGALFTLAGDYQGATEFYNAAIQQGRNESLTKVAQHELDYLLRNLYESRPSYASKEDESPEQRAARKRSEQFCGPMALSELLRRMDIEAEANALATLAGTDETGTSMLGLVTAAESRGVALQGVLASTPEDLPLPAIAFVNQNHFVAVLAVSPSAIEIYDPAKGRLTLDRATFGSLWDGQALVANVGESEPLTKDALASNIGGAGTPQLPSPNYTPYEDYVGGTGGAGFDGNDPSAIAQGPNMATPVTSPGVNLSINAYETAVDMRETDLILGVRGSLEVEFGRRFINEKGYPRTTVNGRLGVGWFNSLSVYILTGPMVNSHDPYEIVSSLVLQDSSGTARHYTLSCEDCGGFNYYERTSTGQTAEKGIVVKATNTTSSSSRKYYVDFPDGKQYVFSAAQSDENSRARLEFIKDAGSANTVTFLYDSTNQSTGKLTKVQSPLGDTRHFLFSYDASSRITKAELKATSTVLQTVAYAYGASDLLTKVTDNGSKTIDYTYGNQGGTSRYIASITDRAGKVTTLNWYFADDAGGAWGANRIDVTPALGAIKTFDRSVTTSVNTSALSDGVSELNKAVVTPLVGDASRTRFTDLYSDSSTYDRWEYEYDNGNDITRRLDGDGNVAGEILYTSSGRISSISNFYEATFAYNYALANPLHPTKVVNPVGLESTYAFDALGRLTSFTHPSTGSSDSTISYDTFGQVTATSDPDGNITATGYDTIGRVTVQTDPLNGDKTYAYDAYGNITSFADQNGVASTFEFDAGSCGGCGGGNVVTKIIDANGDNITFSYDSNGNVTSVTEPLSSSIAMSYDELNRLTKTEWSPGSGKVAMSTYDTFGYLSTKTDPDGNVYSYYYDYRGNLTKTTDAIGIVSEQTYTNTGKVSTITDGLNQTTDLDYRNGMLLTKTTFPNGKVSHRFYDAGNRFTKEAVGSLGSTDPRQFYFAANSGRITKMRHTNGGNNYDATIDYASNGRYTRVTDWLDGSNGLRFSHDSMGRVTQMKDYDNRTFTYQYDAVSQVTSVSDWHGSNYVYTYNSNYKISTVTAPGSKVWTNTYDSSGRLSKTHAPNGLETLYEYGLLDLKPTKVTYKDGVNVLESYSYGYTIGGRLTRIGTNSGSYWKYLYDARDRLTAAERGNLSSPSIAATYKYTYDSGDNLLTMKVPWYDDFQDGNITGWSGSTAYFSVTDGVMKNTLDTTLRDLYLTETDADHDLSFDYIRYSTTGSATVFLRTVGGNDQLYLEITPTNIRLRQVNGGTTSTLATYTTTVSEDMWYKIRAILNGTSVKIYWGAQGASFEEIISATTTETTTTRAAWFRAHLNSEHGFDNVQLIAGTRSTTETFTYNNANEQLTQTKNGVTTTMTYDDWGRMISKYNSNESATYEYRYGDRLYKYESISAGLTKSVIHDYRGDGRRYSTTTGGTTTRYNWDDKFNIVSTGDGSNSLATSFVLHEPGNSVSESLGEIHGATPASGQYRYYFRDNINSTRLLHDQSKGMLGSTEFEPYGSIFFESGAQPLMSYTGKPLDATSGLYVFPYRNYSATEARWTSRDPLGMVDGPNVYGYVRGNPTTHMDPDGRLAPIVIAAVAFVAGIAATVIAGIINTEYDNWRALPESDREDYEEAFKAGQVGVTTRTVTFTDYGCLIYSGLTSKVFDLQEGSGDNCRCYWQGPAEPSSARWQEAEKKAGQKAKMQHTPLVDRWYLPCKVSSVSIQQSAYVE